MGLVKSGSKNKLTLLSEVIYIISIIPTTKIASIKCHELLTDKLLTEVSSIRVLRPPGGASSIFGASDSESSSSRSSTSSESPPPQVRRPYRMASNFELGDEQPPEANLVQNKRRHKPSVNPLTGELVGVFGAEVVKEAPPAPGGDQPDGATPVKSGRVPPGGYSSPLW